MTYKKQRNCCIIFLIFLFSPCVYSYEDNRLIATITAGVNPAWIAITPDNCFGYVANNNNYGITDQDTVSVLNLTNNTVQQIIHDDSFDEPYRIAINSTGTKAYVTNSNGSTITIIDIPTNTVEGLIDGFDGPSGIVITPSGNFAYVNNYGAPAGLGSGNGRTISVVNLNTNTIVETIVVGLAPAALAITPDGAFVYVVNYIDGTPNNGTISVIQTSTNTVVKTITGLSGPFGIAITPNGKYAYVTNFGSNNFIPIGTTVSVVDLSNNTISATINLAIQPSGIAITPDGCFAYATNYNTLYSHPKTFTGLTAGQGTINIIDIATNTVIPPIIAVGQSSNSIAISPNGKFAYVTNYTSNTVSVVKIPKRRIDRMWLN